MQDKVFNHCKFELPREWAIAFARENYDSVQGAQEDGIVVRSNFFRKKVQPMIANLVGWDYATYDKFTRRSPYFLADHEDNFHLVKKPQV